MELVEGETLAARLTKGPLPLDQSPALAAQIAGALAEAHRRGIVHRDLKPANIMLTKSGAKVLDFGLAKMERAVTTSDDVETVTQKGAIIGTLNYMSPEQVQGKEADARSDIFSFGLVLYEMLSGRRAFDGDSAASVMAGILEREAPAIMPEGLNRVVKACLAKDPDDRFQSARDLKRVIEWSVSGSEAAAVVAGTSRRWVPWIAAAVFAALAFLVWLRMGSVATAPPRFALTIVPPSGTSLPEFGQLSTPEISPDGSSVLYFAAGRPYVRRLDSLEPKLLGGLQGITGAAFWSADSRMAAVPTLRGLFRIRVPDGAPEVIAPHTNPTRGGTWSDSGTILISANNRQLYTVPASGGELKLVDVPGMKPGGYKYPQFLPGSEDFLFLQHPDGSEGSEVYLATLRDGKAVNPTLLMKNDTAACYTPAGGGRVFFVRNDTLYSQKVDLKNRKLIGDAEPVQRDVSSIPGLSVDRAGFSVSRTGVVAWRPGKAALNQATIFDRQGKVIGTAGPPSAIESVLLSPDETRVLAMGDGSWLLSPGQSGSLSLGKDLWALWSPDGSRLVGAGRGRWLERSVNLSSEVHELGAAGGMLQDISPDGKQVLTMGGGIFTSHLDGVAQERTPNAVENTGEAVYGPGFSPDGRWIVYSVHGKGSHSSGIYVQPFPGPGLRTQIANARGSPVWRKDGKEIVIADPRGVWSVRVEVAGAALRFGAPELLFSGLRWPVGYNLSDRPLAVSRDGSRFYFPQAVEQPESNVIHVRMGW
jgi:eukaryotic-like serine/threonine-protein kinase